ncbi:MAG: hypothetical protein LBO74_02360 [Candidatus Symbiothrix sp.]|jgi:hypothetical protein|nr:hypothetical protein [Candidatus Symbiothrix sp.]
MKKIEYPLTFAAVILFSLYAFFSCSKEIVPASEFVPYINAYTGGLIYPTSTIQIELANDQADIEINTEVKDKLFSFSPSIKGKAYWVSSRSIEFVPEEGALKSGENYEAEFKLGKVIKVDKRHKTFFFSFKVEERDFDIQEDPLDIIDPKLVTATGIIRFSDDVKLDLVRKAFSAKTSDNQALSPVIESTNNTKIFRYSIADIKRSQTDIDLEITLNGKAFDIDKTFSKTLSIPALDVFKVLSAELISEPENGVRINFSYPVSTTQDLRGLITIPELSNFTRQVQNNRVIIYFERKGVDKITVNVNKGLQNTQGEKLEDAFSITLSLESLKPQVEMLKSGNIIPNVNNLILPFRAVNLSAVDLKIIKIYESNVLMFLQANPLNGSRELRRAGRLVYKKTIQLDNPASKKLQDWQNYSIDLSKIMRQEPGAIYRIELSFKQAYSTYPCENSGDAASASDSGNLTPIASSVDEDD